MLDRDQAIRWHQRYMEIVFSDGGSFGDPVGVLYVPVGGATKAMPIVGVGSSEQLSLLMRTAARELKAEAALVMSEAWMARAKSHEDADRISEEGASKQPDRTEALVITADFGGERMGWSSLITRLPDKSALLGPWSRLPGEVTGRLACILPPSVLN